MTAKHPSETICLVRGNKLGVIYKDLREQISLTRNKSLHSNVFAEYLIEPQLTLIVFYGNSISLSASCMRVLAPLELSWMVQVPSSFGSGGNEHEVAMYPEFGFLVSGSVAPDVEARMAVQYRENPECQILSLRLWYSSQIDMTFVRFRSNSFSEDLEICFGKRSLYWTATMSNQAWQITPMDLLEGREGGSNDWIEEGENPYDADIV